MFTKLLIVRSASSAGNDAISLVGTSTPWHRSSHRVHRPRRPCFETRYHTLLVLVTIPSAPSLSRPPFICRPVNRDIAKFNSELLTYRSSRTAYSRGGTNLEQIITKKYRSSFAASRQGPKAILHGTRNTEHFYRETVKPPSSGYDLEMH